MAEQARAQLCEDAMTMLILWAVQGEYDADLEATLKFWAGKFNCPEDVLNERLSLAADQKLPRPAPRDFGMTHAPSSRHPYASPAAAAAALPPPPHASKSAFASAAAQHSHHEPGYYAPAPAGPYSSGGAFGPGDAAGGGGMSKRPYSAGPGELDPKAFKKQRTVPVVSDLDVLGGVGPYVDIGPAIGRKVLRFWPGDAARNKGSPWFPAVVTDYNELTGIHTITYGFNTTKEEYEEVTLSALDESALKVTDETLDLERMYADLRKRAKSQALAKSEWLKRNAASGTPAFKPGGNIMGGAKKTKSKGKVSGGGGMW
eukprot:jgi/Chrzof1/4167/Cz14g01150.t1